MGRGAAERVRTFWRRETSLTPAENSQALSEENKHFTHAQIASISVKAVTVNMNEVYRICNMRILINS